MKKTLLLLAVVLLPILASAQTYGDNTLIIKKDNVDYNTLQRKILMSGYSIAVGSSSETNTLNTEYKALYSSMGSKTFIKITIFIMDSEIYLFGFYKVQSQSTDALNKDNRIEWNKNKRSFSSKGFVELQRIAESFGGVISYSKE